MPRLVFICVALQIGLVCAPVCAQDDAWTRGLRDATEGATSVRVRSGGTCHRSPEDEELLATVEGAEETLALLERIEIDPEGSGFHCMCCGDPTIEVYRGEELVASLGFHHGHSLRWIGGWEGDGLLTEESAERLVAWMSERGIDGPGAELRREREQEAAGRVRAERQMTVIPPAMLDALRESGSEEEGAAVFRSAGVEGVRVAFAVLGCHSGPWDAHDGFEAFLLEQVLAEAGDDELSEAVRALRANTPEARGCARYLFCDDRRVRRVEGGTLDSALPAICETVLRDAPAINRRVTLSALGRIGSENAAAAIRRVLAEGMPPVAPEDPAAQGSSTRVFRSGWGELKAAASDLTVAAEAAAEMGDGGCLPLVERLVEETPEEDRSRVEAALARLRGRP